MSRNDCHPASSSDTATSRHRSNLDHAGSGCDARSVPQRPKTPSKRDRAPRIRVPNSERAIFVVDDAKFVGVIQRLSLTGGSAVLARGPIPKGAMGEMVLNTVFGRVNAQIEFLQTGADGIPLAQAFRFLAMDDDSSRRYSSAARQMEAEGFSDAPAKTSALTGQASETLSQLLHSVRRLAANLAPRRSSSAKN